jgi:metal-dependent amidase/aminoacylase/carboxypeptidase family protein
VAPDAVLALHNLPGHPRGRIVLRSGVFASASRGLIIELEGASSHAAEPEQGRSPALAVAQLIQVLSAVPQLHTSLHQAAQVTIIHAQVGEVAFGTSPGRGQVMATLRSHSEPLMDELAERCEAYARALAEAHQLGVKVRFDEVFPVTTNDDRLTRVVAETAESLGLDHLHQPTPFPWSEDFGHFTAAYPGVMFGLGAGEHHPPLHSPSYDFPDELIEIGVEMFYGLLERLLPNNRGPSAGAGGPSSQAAD